MSFLFVVGNSRSGTTMMGRILNNHEKVHTFPELHFFEQLWSSNEKKKILSNEQALKLATLLLNISREGYYAKRHTQDFYEEAKRIVDSISPAEITSLKIFSSVILSEAKRSGKEFPCDQTPQNVFYIREILEAFPDSFVLDMVRDPRDVLLSQKRKWKRRFLGGTHATWYETLRAWTNYHPITISKLWNAAIRAGENVNDKRIMKVKFEELLKNPDGTIEIICNHVGISFSPNLKEVPHVGSSSGMDKKEVKGINSDRAQSWNKGGLNKTEIWFCQCTCSNYMMQLGYQPATASPNIFLLIFYYFIFPIKLGFAFLLNLHRMKNIIETVKKRMGR